MAERSLEGPPSGLLDHPLVSDTTFRSDTTLHSLGDPLMALPQSGSLPMVSCSVPPPPRPAPVEVGGWGSGCPHPPPGVSSPDYQMSGPRPG
ncbi:unnamed protein product [Gadus morhua 'NCC']